MEHHCKLQKAFEVNEVYETTRGIFFVILKSLTYGFYIFLTERLHQI